MEIQLLLQFKEKLVSLFESDKVSEFLLSHRVISRDTHDRVNLLDGNLPPGRKGRYLYQQVCDRISEDEGVFNRLVEFLKTWEGGASQGRAVAKDLVRVKEGKMETGLMGGGGLEEKDIPGLLKTIPDCHKWEEIGLALSLPECVREECRKKSSDVLRFSAVLLAWVRFCGGKGVKPATVDSLRDALKSNIVNLCNCAQKLEAWQRVLPEEGHSVDDKFMEISYQSCDTEVSEGKSTLLEVEVRGGGGSESYQWSKDGQPLHDKEGFSGISSNMLYISRATQRSEGKYLCSVTVDTGIKCTDKVKVKVLYPQEKKHLLQLYSHMKKDEPRFNPTFVNLMLVKQTRRNRCDYTVRGDVDDILQDKELVKYEEVFGKFKEGDLVLVEGRPGSGKTTLVNKVTQDWAQGVAILQGAKYVFLVTLRHLNYSRKDKSLIDILGTFYDCETLSKSTEEDLRSCRGKGACFVIDGWDEYKNNKEMESVIYKLIKKTCLPSSMVVVASRPVASSSIRDICSRRIEVVGFTKEQVNRYVETYPFETSRTEASGMAPNLKAFLEHHPNVQHMCYLPVHAQIICFLYNEKEGNIPHMENKIYEEFAISTLLRHKQRNREELHLNSLEELQETEDRLQFNGICKLAYDMVINSQQLVSKEEAQKFLLAEGSFYGLLTVEHVSKRLHDVEEVCTFHHFTFQEYLAARHITGLSEDEQISVICNLKTHEVLKNVRKFYCGMVKYKESKVLRSSNVFLAHLMENPEISFWHCVHCAFESQLTEFCDYIIRDCELYVDGYSASTPADFAALGYVITRASKCVSKLKISACNWAEDAALALPSMDQNNRLVSIKAVKCKVAMLSDDASAALNGLLSQLSSLEEIDLQGLKINAGSAELFTKDVRLPQLSSLKLSLPMAPCSYPEHILRLLKFGSDKDFTVSYNCLKDDLYSMDPSLWRRILSYVFDSRKHSDNHISWLHVYNSNELCPFPQERLSFCIVVNCGIDDEVAKILAVTLNPSVLEKLVLDFNRISDSGAKALATCLAGSCVLREVSVQCNSIGDSGARAIADAIGKCGSLRKLDLQGNIVSDEGAVSIAETMKDVPGLDLYLHNIDVTEEGISRVLQHRATTHIETMVFGSSWNSICDGGTEALRRAFLCKTLPALRICVTDVNYVTTNMKNIETVIAESVAGVQFRSLSVSWINAKALSSLCGILNYTKHLHHLHFENSFFETMEGDVWNDFCAQLNELTCLRSLSLCCSSELLSVMLENFKGWPNLQSLDLCKNTSKSHGVDVLCKVLVQCKSLHHLDFSDYEMGDSGAEALAEALKDHTSLRQLKINGYCTVDKLSLVGMNSWSKVIRSNSIQHLDLSHQAIWPTFVYDQVRAIWAGRVALSSDVTSSIIERRNNLRTLSIGSNLCISSDVLCEHLKSFTNLEKLDVSFKLGTSGELLASFIEALKCCKQLTELDVSCNNIGILGKRISLDSSFKFGWQLVKLDMSSNNLCSQGMEVLAETLQRCINLQVLNLAKNMISFDGVAALLEVMDSHPYLKELELEGNNIGIDGAADLVKGWKHKTVLKLGLEKCFDWSHEKYLVEGKRYCPYCHVLLHNNHFVIIHIALTKCHGEVGSFYSSTKHCLPKIIPK